MPAAELDTMLCVASVSEVDLDASVLRLLILAIAVGVFHDHCCVADWVEVMS